MSQTSLQHIHVDRDALTAKFWLQPVALARNFGFNAKELSQVEKVVSQHQQTLKEAWYEFFGT